MKYIEVIANQGNADTVAAIAEKAHAQDFRLGITGEDGMQSMRILVSDDKLQSVLDTLQSILGAQPTAKIVVLSVESILPQPDEERRKQEGSATAAREAIYQDVEKSARLDFNFVVLVILSTLVAGIGLIENNVAV